MARVEVIGSAASSRSIREAGAYRASQARGVRAVTDTVIFSDGTSYMIGVVRATHVLAKRRDHWSNGAGVTAVYMPAEMFHVTVGGISFYLKHDPPNARYIAGGWPHAVATVFALRTDTPGVLVLHIHDAEKIRG